jgi:hypothetical protein
LAFFPGFVTASSIDDVLLRLYSTASVEGKKTLRSLHDLHGDQAKYPEAISKILEAWDAVTADYLTQVTRNPQLELTVKDGRQALDSLLNSYVREGFPVPEKLAVSVEKIETPSPAKASGHIPGVHGGLLSTVKGKSTRTVNFIYEAKDFESKTSNNTRKEIDRFMVETSYKWQFNDRNSLTVQVPYSESSLTQTVGGNSQKYNLRGARDVKVSHEMTTETLKPNQTTGRVVKWKFDLNLPTGKEQLTGEEALITSAIGENGEAFSKGTHGAGFNVGVGLGIDYKKGNTTDKYLLTYMKNGNHSTLIDKVSYKESGDNIMLGYTRERKLNERNTLSWGLGNTWTLKSMTLREDPAIGIINSYTGMQQEKKATINLQMERIPKKFWEIITLEYKQKGYNEVNDIERFEKTDQGDRYYAKWNFRRKLNDKVQIDYGINAIFGRPNTVVENFTYATNAVDASRLGLRPETKWEEVDLVFRRQLGGEKDRRKWWYQATVGLTEESRDYTLSTGFNYMF